MSFHSADPAFSAAPFAPHGEHAGRSGGHAPLLPDQIEESIRGAFNRLAGALLIAAALACWAALLTWSIDDPTLTRSGAGTAGNLLGGPGAAASDILLRCLGLASAFTLLPLVFWGVSLVFRERVARWRVKFMLWVAGTLGVAGAFASVPTIQAWRIPHGFGGLAGDFVYALAGNVMGHVSAGHGSALAAFALLAGGAAALFGSLGAGRDELGMIWHGDAWQRVRRPSAVAVTHHAPAWQPDPLVVVPSANKAARPSPVAGPSLIEMAVSLWRHRPGRADRRTLHRAVDRSAGATQPHQRNAYDLQMRPTSAAPVGTASPHGGHQPVMHGQPFTAGSHPGGSSVPPAPSYAGDVSHDAALMAELDAESRAIAARFAPRGAGGPRPAMAAAPAPSHELPMAHAQAPSSQKAPAQFEFDLPPAAALPSTASTRDPAVAAAPPASPPAPAARGLMRGWKGRAAQRHPGRAYRPPALTLLKRVAAAKPGPEYSQNVQRGVAKLLEDVLIDFGIKGQIQAVKPGPVVTLYELEPARGIKSSRIVGLSDDIARSMSATSARVAGIPGRNVIGIELPNMRRETVYLRELLESETYQAGQSTLPMVLGKGIGGEPIVADLARMPHVLVAGTTGSGKSVGINAMILSLLYRLGPEQCRFLMIDPKMLELSVYNGIPHLLAPVITEPHKAVAALNWVVREMEERYKRMAQLAVRNIEVFNGRVRQAAEQGEELARTVQTGFDPMTGEPIFETERMQLEAMPYIVVVVDEMADLMLTAGKEIEGAVQRLAQMARAAGIHLIMATQRPSVDVITGTIKANFPTRISFKVTSKIDSRTILGEQGAEQLLGAGDMLFSTGTGQIVRVHGPFVADEEVEQIAAYLRTLGEPAYVDGIGDDAQAPDELIGEEPRDESEDIYDKAVAVVLRDRKASTSYIQRRLSIGYNRAADIMERMEREGLVSAANSVGKRNILVGESKAG